MTVPLASIAFGDVPSLVVIGVAVGAIYAIAAGGLVVTYTTSGIFNFAHGAIGMVMAFAYWELHVNHGLPAPLALVLVLLVIAPMFGVLVERLLIRGINPADTGTALVVTLGLFLALFGLAYVVWPNNQARVVQPFFGDRTVKLLDFAVSYHQVVMLLSAVAVAVGLRLLLFSTRVGVAMRAVVDDRDLAALNGVHPQRVSQLSWALGSMLAGLAGVLLASQLNLEVLSLTLLVVKGYAAAVFGRLASLPRTFLGAVVIGLTESFGGRILPSTGVLNAIKPVLATLLLFLALLVVPSVRLRAGRAWGRATLPVPSLRRSLLSGAAFVAVVGLVSPFLNGDNLIQPSIGLGVSLILLSLTVLTGYGGQVSLCQFTLVGVGTYTFSKVASTGNPLGLLAVILVTGAVGALVALPALRLQGLYLALSTLAFAALADYVFFGSLVSKGALPVPRLSLFGLSASGDRANLILLAVTFAVFANLVLAMRRGPFGRVLAAMRDSPAACATLGLNLTTVKVSVFALSASMAGVAGVLWGGTKTLTAATDYIYIQSLVLLLIITVAGVDSVSGALIAGLLLALGNIATPHIPERLQQLTYLGTALGALTLGRQPNGIVGLLSGLAPGLRRRAVWRWPSPLAATRSPAAAAATEE